jgi:mRNA-degrading endonuclease RelE of RelBE toxin-antitoxin system
MGLRMRVGDYRVVFDETKEEITILAAGHRREVYR